MADSGPFIAVFIRSLGVDNRHPTAPPPPADHLPVGSAGLGSYVPPKKRRMETLRREGDVSLPQPVQEEPELQAAAATPQAEHTEAG